MEQLIIPAIIAIAVAFFSVYGLTPYVIRALEKRNITVVDVNKKEKTMIPRPGGLSIIVGMELSLIILYIFFICLDNIDLGLGSVKGIHKLPFFPRPNNVNFLSKSMSSPSKT